MASTTGANIGHSTKKLFTRVSTSRRVLNAGLNQEFVDTRNRLQAVSLSLQDLHKQILESRHVWNAVACSQRDFARRLSSSFPQSGAVQSHAAEVERVLRDVQRALIDTDAKGGATSSTGLDVVAATERAPHLRIADVLQRYVQNVAAIQQEYRDIEVTYTEKARYEQKVDKLERRTNTLIRNKDGGERLRRNMQKLDGLQSNLDNKMDTILTRMRDAWQKHEAVLQCAHHAFWCANNVYMSTVERATHDIREESQVARSVLLSLDMREGQQVLPIERRYTSEGSEGERAPGSRVSNDAVIAPAPVPDLSDSEGTGSIVHSQDEEHAKTGPNPPVRYSSDSGSYSPMTETEPIVLQIPEVPTEKPPLPVKTNSISSTPAPITMIGV